MPWPGATCRPGTGAKGQDRTESRRSGRGAAVGRVHCDCQRLKSTEIAPPMWFGCNYFFDAGGGPLLTIRVARVGGVVTGRAMMI